MLFGDAKKMLDEVGASMLPLVRCPVGRVTPASLNCRAWGVGCPTRTC